jgi:hypothetical protein
MPGTSQTATKIASVLVSHRVSSRRNSKSDSRCGEGR